MVCGNFILPEPASYVFFYAVFNLRKLLYIIPAVLEHGEVDISNNFAENAIRPFAQGRKAWLFCDTPEGADSSAIVLFIVETAKANGLDPYTYLKLLLTELPYLGKNPASDKLDLFMPWTAAIRKNCILPTKKISPEEEFLTRGSVGHLLVTG